MHSQRICGLVLFFGMFAGMAMLAPLHARDDTKKIANAPKTSMKTDGAVKPKSLSSQINKGLAYLAGQQHRDGGWGQGGGWRTVEGRGRVEGPNIEDPSDVANTCIATLAMLRAGNSPKAGPYATNVGNAIEFICGHIGKADKDTLYVTDVRGTQVQSKIGPYVDTFLATLVLAEVKGQMPSEQTEKRLVTCLGKAVAKIEKNQKENGSFAGNEGWASVFSQGLASKGLNRASQNGFEIAPIALQRAENNAIASIDLKKGAFKSGESVAMGGAAPASSLRAVDGAARFGGSGGGIGAGLGLGAGMGASDAGVRLYAYSNQTAALQEAANTNKDLEKKAREIVESKTATPADKQKAQGDLSRFAKLEEARKVAVKEVVDQLGNKNFVQGFGSNGGEEFLSYLNIGETLVVKGGSAWEKWDRSITENLNRIQNQDGSWSGDHCITGRTFCTGSALLVLMADRTPIPVPAKTGAHK
jgi:hypothetical protein